MRRPGKPPNGKAGVKLNRLVCVRRITELPVGPIAPPKFNVGSTSARQGPRRPDPRVISSDTSRSVESSLSPKSRRGPRLLLSDESKPSSGTKKANDITRNQKREMTHSRREILPKAYQAVFEASDERTSLLSTFNCNRGHGPVAEVLDHATTGT